MANATSGIVGTRLDESNTDQLFALGQCLPGTDGTEWVYVQASGAITQYDCVAVDENYQAAAMTHALAGAGHKVGFAQFAFADNEFGFVALSGSNISCRVAAGCAPDVGLYTTDVAGVLDDASSTSINLEIVSVVAVASGTASAVASVEVIAQYPHTNQ